MTRRQPATPVAISKYADGCSFHAQCLTCPLVMCRHDAPGGLEEAIALTPVDQLPDSRETWPYKALAMRKQGKPVYLVAVKLGKSPRAVFRALQKLREAA